MKAFLALITFKEWRERREANRRRRNYEEIKALIVKRHLEGFGGVVLTKKYDAKDLACFQPPMYFCARTANFDPVVTWRKDLMTLEVANPQPSNVIILPSK